MTNKNQPIVSWLICCNTDNRKQISRTLHSIFDQKFNDHEIVFVSNGRDCDRIDQIVSEIAVDSPIRITGLRTATKGLTYSLNLGLQKCSGIYLARLDVGDVTVPNRLEIQVPILNRGDRDYSGVGSQYRSLGGEQAKISNLPLDSHSIANGLWKTCTLCHPSMLLRVEAVRSVGGYGGFAHSEDFELWLRMTREGHQFVNVRDCLVDYEPSGGQARGNPRAYAGIVAYFFYEVLVAPRVRSVLGIVVYLAKFGLACLRHTKNRGYQ
jgi:glycosyltransferase involved in cell wall biosynthesis